MKTHYRSDFDIVFPGETLAYIPIEKLGFNENKEKTNKRVAAEDLDRPAKKTQETTERFFYWSFPRVFVFDVWCSTRKK